MNHFVSTFCKTAWSSILDLASVIAVKYNLEQVAFAQLLGTSRSKFHLFSVARVLHVEVWFIIWVYVLR